MVVEDGLRVLPGGGQGVGETEVLGSAALGAGHVRPASARGLRSEVVDPGGVDLQGTWRGLVATSPTTHGSSATS